MNWHQTVRALQINWQLLLNIFPLIALVALGRVITLFWHVSSIWSQCTHSYPGGSVVVVMFAPIVLYRPSLAALMLNTVLFNVMLAVGQPCVANGLFGLNGGWMRIAPSPIQRVVARDPNRAAYAPYKIHRATDWQSESNMGLQTGRQIDNIDDWHNSSNADRVIEWMMNWVIWWLTGSGRWPGDRVGAWQTVGAEIGLLNLLFRHSPGGVIRKYSAYTWVPP